MEDIKAIIEKIRAEIDAVYEDLDGYDPESLGTFANEIDRILDKYKAETEAEDGNDRNN